MAQIKELNRWSSYQWIVVVKKMSAATQEQGKNALDAEKQKVIQSLEEDDEFEDFQAEGMC